MHAHILENVRALTREIDNEGISLFHILSWLSIVMAERIVFISFI